MYLSSSILQPTHFVLYPSFCPITPILSSYNSSLSKKQKHIASQFVHTYYGNYMPIDYTTFKESTICISFISDTLTTPNKVCSYPFTNRLRMSAAPSTNTTQPMWNIKLYGSMYGAAIGSC